MSRPLILIVEDNALTRKMFRLTLEAEGYLVVEAPDGRTAIEMVSQRHPTLILQDLMLPDIDGFELVRKLRALSSSPILAVSGLLTRLEEAQVSSIGFDDFLVKPVALPLLRERVREHLPRAAGNERLPAAGKRVLVVDDDSAQLRLVSLQLTNAGFQVSSVSDAQKALELARREIPDAIASDLFMPGFDGFEFCLNVRRDPQLKRVPVVLYSAAYLEEVDAKLVENVGSSAYVVRTPDPKELIEALRAALENGPPELKAEAVNIRESGYLDRAVRQLERQASMNLDSTRRCTLQAAQLSALNAICSVAASAAEIGVTLDEILNGCVEAAGVSFGALYLSGKNGRLQLYATSGKLARQETLDSLANNGELFEQALANVNSGFAFPSAEMQEGQIARVLREAGATSAVAVPILSGGGRIGTLLLASEIRRWVEDDWFLFARTAASQMSQAIVLAKAVTQAATSEQRYRDLIENANDIVYELDLHGLLVSINAAAERITGYSRGELLGRSLEEIVAPESRETVRQMFAEQPERNGSAHELEVVSKSGSRIALEVSNRHLREEGKTIGVQGIARDVTERRNLAAQLRQAQKMEAIGQLAGGVAHDFNNLMTIVKGYSGMVLSGAAGPADAREAIVEINRAANRAADLTKQLLAFSRRQVLQPRVLDLNQVLLDTQKMLSRLIGEDIELTASFSALPAVVRVDPGQIEQVIINLAVNSRDAMPQGGKVHIETSILRLDEVYVSQHSAASPGEYVILSVSDTGAGMDAESKSHIFEPFFTTKEVGKGTGLGLATVYGIVKQSGGSIWVYSEPNLGTTFKIYLPYLRENAGDSRDASGTGFSMTGSETILLVEDEPTVRKLVGKVLRMSGYKLLEAHNGQTALDLVGKNTEPLHLLLTDVVMPGISGRELAEKVRLKHPEIKVLFMSGYTDDAVVRHGLLEASVFFLQKPFSMEEVGRKVREALGAPT